MIKKKKDKKDGTMARHHNHRKTVLKVCGEKSFVLAYIGTGETLKMTKIIFYF